MSGTRFKSKYNTLLKVLNNWNDIPQIINKTLDEIIFINQFSKEKKPEIKKYSDLVNFLTFVGIKNFGITESIRLFDEKIDSTNKSKIFKKFLDIYKCNIDERPNLKLELMNAVNNKLDRLYNKSNITY